MSDSPAIAYALLLGGEFEEGGTYLVDDRHLVQWRVRGQGNSYGEFTTRWMPSRAEAAIVFLSHKGYWLLVTGELVKI